VRALQWRVDGVVKVILDLFVESVLELNFYGVRHSSDRGVAVEAARELVARGEPVPGHASLVGAWSVD